MPKPRQDPLSITFLLSTLCSPFLQCSSHLSPHQHTMTLFTSQTGFFAAVILPSVVPSLPCNSKAMEHAAMCLGLLTARALPPLHRQAVCRTQRAVLDPSSSLLLQISAQLTRRGYLRVCSPLLQQAFCRSLRGATC